MFDDELRMLLEGGYVLGGRVGYLAGHEIKARADGAIERVDHDAFVQLVVGRDVREMIVRVESPGVPSPQVVVLVRDDAAPPRVLVESGGLYLGGRLRVVERIDDPARAEERWASRVGWASCWDEGPARGCC